MPQVSMPTQEKTAPTHTATTSASSSSSSESRQSTSGTVSWEPEEVPQLTVDVYRKENTIFIVSTVAGVNPKDLDISIETNTLSIKGVRRKPYDSDVSLLLEECFWGEFYRELTINENLDVDAIKASINQGILVIEVPLLQLTPHRKIEVNLGA
jgi:HSP20 family protein